jgi:hypothetical protein
MVVLHLICLFKLLSSKFHQGGEKIQATNTMYVFNDQIPKRLKKETIYQIKYLTGTFLV